MKIESRLLPANAPSTRADRVASFMRDVMSLPADKAFVLEAKPASRSLLQNRYLFACYQKVADHMRNTHGMDHGQEVWHQWFKGRACPSTVTQVMGNKVRVYTTTTTLTTREFSEYTERVRDISAEELDLVLPEPDWNWRQAESEKAA